MPTSGRIIGEINYAAPPFQVPIGSGKSGRSATLVGAVLRDNSNSDWSIRDDSLSLDGASTHVGTVVPVGIGPLGLPQSLTAGNDGLSEG